MNTPFEDKIVKEFIEKCESSVYGQECDCTLMSDFLSSVIRRSQEERDKEAIGLLKEAASYLINSGIVNAIYIPPAQQLRNEADEIERKDDFIKRLKTFLNQK